MHAKFSSAPAAPTPRVAPPDPHKLQFRAGSNVKLGAVDAAAGTINGVSIITADREAGGWGMWIDQKTVTGFHVLLSGRRLKAYATHGSWGRDGTLDEIGYWDSAVVDGPHLRQNFTALAAWKKHHADEYDTLFELADKLPTEFGASVSFRLTLAWVMPDGREVPTLRKWRFTPDDGYEEYFDPAMPTGALRALPSVRPVEVYSADFVDQPAANTGLFRAASKDPEVDASANGNFSAMPTIKEIQARFGSNSAHVARAIALFSANDKLTLDEVAKTIEAEEQAAKLSKLESDNKRLLSENATHTATLKEKETRITSLEADLKARDATIAAFKKEGAPPVPAGAGGGEGGETDPIAACRAELSAITGTDAASAKRRGELTAKLKKLKAAKK